MNRHCFPLRISIQEFNADQFQTNLAILLGIPPERIVVAAVQARRRLSLVDTEASEEPCDDCQTPRRRLVVNSQTALDVQISPSGDAARTPSKPCGERVYQRYVLKDMIFAYGRCKLANHTVHILSMFSHGL